MALPYFAAVLLGPTNSAADMRSPRLTTSPEGLDLRHRWVTVHSCARRLRRERHPPRHRPVYSLGSLLANVLDPPDLAGARRWWLQAAEAGHTGAADNLQDLTVLSTDVSRTKPAHQMRVDR
jgi:hypothetical protein